MPAGGGCLSRRAAKTLKGDRENKNCVSYGANRLFKEWGATLLREKNMRGMNSVCISPVEDFW